MLMHSNAYTKERGVTTLIAVLVFGTVGAALAFALLELSIRDAVVGITSERWYRAISAADTCAEEALEQIRENTSYTGSGSVTFSATLATCSYLVTNVGGSVRTINATGTFDTVSHAVRLSTSALSPSITLSTWKDTP